MPIIHTIVFVALNIIYIEDVEIFQDIFIFFVPVIAGSIICGVWGLNMLVSFRDKYVSYSSEISFIYCYILKVRMIAPYYADFRLMGKYFALQLVLILCKLQPVLLQSILKIYIRYCPPPFSLSLQINSKYKSLTKKEIIHNENISFSFYPTVDNARNVTIVYLGSFLVQESIQKMKLGGNNVFSKHSSILTL